MNLNNKNILTLVATGFLFYALSDGLPIGYFTLLRFVVCAVSLYLAYKIYEENKESLWIWAFGFVAVLFNPIIPIVLKRDVWESIDLATGIFFILSIFLLKKNNSVSTWFKSSSIEKVEQKNTQITTEKLINKKQVIDVLQWVVVVLFFIGIFAFVSIL